MPPAVNDRAFAEPGTDILTDADEVIAALAEIAEAKWSARSGNQEQASLSDRFRIFTVGLSSALRTSPSRYITTARPGVDDECQRIEAALVQFLLDPRPRKISFQLSFELECPPYFYGNAVVHTLWGDAQAQVSPGAASPPTQAERMDSLSLEFIGLDYFGIDIKAINNTDRKNLDKTPVDVVLRYNAIDAKYHRLAYLAQLPLSRPKGLLRLPAPRAPH